MACFTPSGSWLSRNWLVDTDKADENGKRIVEFSRTISSLLDSKRCNRVARLRNLCGPSLWWRLRIADSQ